MRDLIGTRRVLPVVLAVGALLVMALVAVPLALLHRGPSGAHAAPAPTPTTSPVPIPSGAVALVQGTRLADGVQVGYPHTLLGAISAAAAYLGALASTLDPHYAASLGRTLGDPTDPTLAADLASSVAKLRTALQLPTTGALPAPVAFLTTPQMYQLRDTDRDHALVLLLTSNTFINAHGGLAETTGVFPLRMHFSSGDWRIAHLGDTNQDYSSLNAPPASAAALGKGWQNLLPAPTAGGAP
jgi:hypothetical protein